MSLTRCRSDAGGRMCGVYTWRGATVRAYDDALTGLRLIELFADEGLDADTKAGLVVRMLFPDPEAVAEGVEDMAGLVCTLLWEVAGLDVTGERNAGGERIIDWERDEAVIRDSLWMVYGKSFDDIRLEVTLRELVEMLAHCPHETPMGQALYYRTAKEPRGGSAEEARAFRERKRHWALEPSDGGRSADERASQVFEMIRKGVENG